MRQVFHAKGGESTGKKRQSEAWSRRLEWDVTKLKQAPLVDRFRSRIVTIAKALDRLGSELTNVQPAAIVASHWETADLRQTLREAELRCRDIRNSMVAWQEELDWTVYAAFGLTGGNNLAGLDDLEPVASEHRPFAIRLARRAATGEVTRYWFEAMVVEPSADVPACYREDTTRKLRQRLELIETNEAVGLIEGPEYKRKWEPMAFRDDIRVAALQWLSTRIEDVVRSRNRPAVLQQIVAAVQDDSRFLAVASIYQNRRDVDVTGLVRSVLESQSVPNHPFHTYTSSGLAKRRAWEDIWSMQRRKDAGENVGKTPPPPEYSQGSRGKAYRFPSCRVLAATWSS